MQKPNEIELSRVFITREELKEMGIGVSNSTLLRWEDTGNFPKRVRLSNGNVVWVYYEISNWVLAKIAQRQMSSNKNLV